jgi:GMP synthase-like glutamine amidotransferase
VAKGSLYGLQFHPEKSSEAGLRVLANFVGLVAAGASAAGSDAAGAPVA